MSLSEIVDEPQPYESSEDEWVERNGTKKRATKRMVKRNSSVSKPKESDTEDSETDTQKQSNGVSKNKRRRGATPKKSSTQKTAKKSNPKVISSDSYATGSFVILKKDAQVGDPHKHPWIWRIDGKSLLQKYEPFEHAGRIRHKNTSVYTGWSPLDMDDYAPVTIDLIEQSSGKIIVELHWEELKSIVQDDSD